MHDGDRVEELSETHLVTIAGEESGRGEGGADVRHTMDVHTSHCEVAVRVGEVEVVRVTVEHSGA